MFQDLGRLWRDLLTIRPLFLDFSTMRRRAKTGSIIADLFWITTFLPRHFCVHFVLFQSFKRTECFGAQRIKEEKWHWKQSKAAMALVAQIAWLSTDYKEVFSNRE